ncbi:MAG: phosphatidylserine decarboxylase [Candidatus Thorarchaeota archaeon]
MILWIIISSLLLAFILLVPLSIKWNIELKISLTSASIIGLSSGLLVTVGVILWNFNFLTIIILEILLILIISGSFVSWRFYRDPERSTPLEKNTILSPADGKCIYVKKIEKGKIPYSDKQGAKFSLKDFVQTDYIETGGHLIGIEMSVLDVHVNRAPVGGEISLLKHIKGGFFSMKKKEAIIRNDRVLTVIENKYFKLGVVQITTRLVRKIISYVNEGQQITKGDRIGMIKFGSQVDVILPNHPSIEIKITPGDKVQAGTSIIATTGLLEIN